ncbi:DUF3800 domain-containing protein, partial [Mycoplasma marinum]
KILFLEETSHLSFQTKPLVIGGWVVPKTKMKQINNEIKKIKLKHGVKTLTEIKWTKIGKSKINLYKELVEYAIQNEYMQLRVLVAGDKKNIKLNYKDWYTRLHFSLIKKSPFAIRGIISDRKGSGNEESLISTLEMASIPQTTFVDSKESQIIQLSDLFLGAISCYGTEIKSIWKEQIYNIIANEINIGYTTSLYSNQIKYNIFYWKGE